MFLRLTMALALTTCSLCFAEGYRIERIVNGYGFNGIHGITFDSQDNLYVGSVIGQAIYKVHPITGDAHTHIGLPEGMADDLEFGPDGMLAWTSFNLGIVHAKTGDEPIKVLASGLPGINSIAFKEDGRLFATQVFLGDALYEIDVTGENPPTKILEDMGGLNGFDFGPDGMLYGPLWFKGQVVKVDVDTKELTVVAEGFEIPAAVNFDSQGNLWVIDTKAGKIYRVDIESGEKTEVSDFMTAMDNLAFNSKDELFVTVMANNAIYQIDTETGDPRRVKSSDLAIPCDLALVTEGGRDILYVADVFSLRSVDALTRRTTDIARNYGDELENPIGIYADEEHILAVSWFSGTVQQFDRDTGESIIIAHDFAAPMDAAILPNGDWLVLEGPAGRLLRVAGSARDERNTVAEGLTGGVGLVLSGETTAYVTCIQGGRVVKVDLESGTTNDVVSGLVAPEGIAEDSDGMLIIAEVGRQRLVSLDPNTGKITELMGDLTIGLPGPPGTPQGYTPTGIAVSDSGAVYFTSDIEDAIYKLTPK